jgi:hypothetical protein
MRRVLIPFVLITLLFGVSSLLVAAQDATPPAEGELPFEPLAFGPSTLAPDHVLVLGRVTFEPGFTETHAHTHPSDYVVSIESGSLAFTIEAGTLLILRAGTTEPEPAPIGEEVTLGPGDSFAGTPDVVWASERVVGDDPVVLLGALLGPPDAPDTVYVDATPAATPAG